MEKIEAKLAYLIWNFLDYNLILIHHAKRRNVEKAGPARLCYALRLCGVFEVFDNYYICQILRLKRRDRVETV